MSPQVALRRVFFVTLGLIIVLGGGVLLMPAASVAAAPQSYVVTTTDDTPTDANCTADSCTLRQAVNASNLNAPGASPAHNTITFAGGVGSITLMSAVGHGTLTLMNNSVVITGAGAVSVDGGNSSSIFAVSAGVTASIDGVTINNGNGLGGGGGVRNDGTLTLANLAVQSSTSDGGGGVLNNSDGTLTVTNCYFTSDSAPGLGGGAIFNGGTAMITNSTFLLNNAGFGGAIGNSGMLTVTGSTFAANSATGGSGKGGAIANTVFLAPARAVTRKDVGSQSVQLTNSTFSGNSADTMGGAIYSDIALQTTNVTVNGNQAVTNGGGIFSAGAATLTNTVVAGSTGGDLANGGTGAFTGNTNLVADDTFGLLSGTGNLNLPPLLDPNGVQFNGGTTQTVALLPGSPAIGGGTLSGEGIPTTDQRTIARTGRNDIGAFQSQGFTLTLTNGTTPQSTIVNSPFMNPLGAIVASTNNEPVIGGTVTFTLPSGSTASGFFNTPSSCTVSGDGLTATCPITGTLATSCAAKSPRPAGCGSPSSGTATSPTVIANGTAGTYNATATTSGAPPAAPIVLTNQIVACVVNSTQDPDDPGKTTLSNAIDIANNGGCSNNNTITFDSTVFPPSTPATITVNPDEGPFLLAYGDGPTTIDGSGHMVVIDGGGATTIFVVLPGVTGTLNTLKMQNGANFEGGGAIFNFGTLTVVNSTFDHNDGAFGAGGAIENLNTLTVTNSTFSNNTASDGGAIDTNIGLLTVTGSTFVGNTAKPSTDPTPSHAARLGRASSRPTRTVGKSRPVRAADESINTGGAIFICSCTSAQITNSTFSGNTATNQGGAILDEGGLTLTNVTINGNSANNGGGVFLDAGTTPTRTDSGSGATLTAKNVLIAGNTLSGSGGAGPDVNGAIDPASANNLIGIGDGSTGIANGTNGNRIGTAAAPIAPLLGTLGNFGGTTQTIPLLPGSVAIDAGATGTSVLTTDQRGKPRVGAPDIGAFESQGFILAIVSGTPQTAPPSTAFAPLVVSVTSTAAEPVAGGTIIFTGPTTGAAITTSPLTATIAATGQASVSPTANATTGGPYAVTATTSGTTPPSVSFQLTNGVPILTVTGPAHLKVGETQQYTATPSIASSAARSLASVVWTSSDVTVATVSSDGKLSALRPGTVTLTATSNGLTGSLIVQVDPANLTGVQPAPAPAGRPSGAASTPVKGSAPPAPAPPSR